MRENNHYWQVMCQEYERAAGSRPTQDSDVGIRFAALAQVLEELDAHMLLLERQSLPQTATGSYLDRHAAQRGLTRKGAVQAVGRLRFTRTSAATEDIPIPKGLVCTTVGTPLCRYVTTQGAVLAAGQTQVEVPAQAQEGGVDSNTAKHTVNAMVTPVGYVSAVTNPEPFTGGMDAETDEQLRRRLLESYAIVSNGTNAAFYRKEALEQEGVYSAKVLSRARGVGTVDVVLGGFGTPAGSTAVQALQAHLQERKEINVDVKVQAAVAKPQNIAVQVQCAANITANTLLEQVRQTVTRQMRELGVGEPLRIARLTQQIMNLAGVENCRITTPAADVAAEERELIVLGTLTAAEVKADG